MPKNLYDLDGPYLCDEFGEYITAESAADPEYIPYVRFEHKIPNARRNDLSLDRYGIYIYRPDTDELFDYNIESAPPPPIITKIEERQSYHEELIERIRTFDIKVWKENNLFKFALPLIRKSWPKLNAQRLVSVQPMTSPLSAIFYMNQKYGQSKGANAGSSKNPV